MSGANRLPMADFRTMLEGLGLGRVQTYIQSGNAVFDSDLAVADLEPMIRDAVAARFGFAPEVFVRDGAEVAAALSDHPFAGADPARVHVCFTAADPRPDAAAMRALALPGDGWHIGPRRITVHTPGGVGTSKLMDRLPRLIGTPMTARNLRTIAALQAILAARD